MTIAQIPIFADDVAASSAAAEKFMGSLDGLAAWTTGNAEKLGKCVGSNQPFYLAYRPYDVGAALSRYGDILCPAAAAYWQPDARRAGAPRAPPARTRMVVVSGQVRQHPVWEIILRGMIEHLDRGRFEIIIYHTGSTCDAETLWAKAHVDRFVQGPMPVKGWLDEMRHDLPDVIFYPEVGMDPATSALAALRLAPLQIAAWGHPVTTGLPTMDLFLSGELLEDSGAEQHYREKLIRLPGTGVCTQVVTRAARPWAGPQRAGNIVRFALCQQPIKFDPADDVLLTADREGSRPMRILAGDTGEAPLGCGQIARSAGGRLPRSRPRSGCVSARDALVARASNSSAFWMRWIFISIAPHSPATRPPGKPFIGGADHHLGRALHAPAPGGGPAAADRPGGSDCCIA